MDGSTCCSFHSGIGGLHSLANLAGINHHPVAQVIINTDAIIRRFEQEGRIAAFSNNWATGDGFMPARVGKGVESLIPE